MIKMFIRLLFFIILFSTFSYCDIVRIGTYNVNNLFDQKDNGKEFANYTPDNQDSNWTNNTYGKKIDNIAKVLKDLKADIIGLQEVESLSALKDLNKSLNYKYQAIANDGGNTKVALLSNYEITSSRSIEIASNSNFRSILEVHLKINNNPLTIFVVHWHSKNFPETYRRQSAQVLKWRLIELGVKQDYLILGDFNSNYNEFLTIKGNYFLNDTFGETGINHTLNTLYNGHLITRSEIIGIKSHEYLYNLWLELENQEDRFSMLYNSKPQTPDNILMSKSLFDDQGLNYIDQSFNVFKPDYLYNADKKMINRWENVNGKFTGKGYSDHLPIYADFDLVPFKVKVDEIDTRMVITLDKLFEVNIRDSNFLIRNIVALYQDQKGTIIKDPNGRAMYVVGHNDKFKVGHKYEVDIVSLDEEYGLRVIKDIGLVVDKGLIDNVEIYKIHNTNIDFNNLLYQNEVISEIKGKCIRGGYFEYSGQRQKETIKIVFKNQALKPQENEEVTFKDVVVSFEKQPILLVQ